LGFEESVELAGDVADQAASDLTVGLALGAASLDVGASRWVIESLGHRVIPQESPQGTAATAYRPTWPRESKCLRLEVGLARG